MRLPISLVIALCLTGCGPKGWWVKPDPPQVTGCLERPEAYVPDEPVGPPPGAPIPDAYVVALKGWGNALLGVITADRIGWRGERRCILRLRDEEQVQ